MTTFPKILKKVEGAANVSADRGKDNTFQLSFKTTTFESQIVVHNDSLFIISDNTFQLSKNVLLFPQYLESGSLKALIIESQNEQLTIRHDQPDKLQDICQRLSRFISHKGFNEYYKPLKRLGRGTFASVYLVEHRFTKKVCAAKVFGRCQQYLEIDGKAALQNEISIMRDIDHPNIMSIYAVHETQNLVYLIVEYMGGGTLEDYMRSRLHLSGQDVVKIIKQILSALSYLDSKGIMHRDLKPSNIMLRKDTGDWVLTDLGLAARVNTNYLYQKCGTPGFVAPEILRLQKPEEKYTQSCDMFSFGIIVYMMIIGKMPFQGQQQEQLYEMNKKCQIKFSEKDKEQLHPDILKFLLCMLQSDPIKRVKPRKLLESTLLTNSDMTENLVAYFKNLKQRAMKKVLQFANHVNT